MSQVELENLTSFAVKTLFLSDEEARCLLVPLVKSTYLVKDSRQLVYAEKQVDLNLTGAHFGDQDSSSYKYEPEIYFIKQSTDVVVVGSACAHKAGVDQVDVGLSVGPIRKTVRVFGNRYWSKGLTGIAKTEPRSFEAISLCWENSFGGWDRSHPDPSRHTFEPRNPVGTGFRAKWGKFEEGVRLPNLEDPNDPLKSHGQVVKPVGFGFTSPHWQPRASFAGTYDETWMKERMPLLPKDFDRRFFNGAPTDQIVPGYLRGDEEVMITNVTPSGSLSFRLPGVPPPECDVEFKGGRREVIPTNLDTVIINTDENLVFLLWRAHLAVREGPHGVKAIRVSIPGYNDAKLAS